MSLRLRLLLGLLLIALVSFVVTSLVNILFFRGIYLDFLRTQGAAITDFLRAKAGEELDRAPEGAALSLAGLSGELRKILERNRELSDLFIVDARGKIMAHPNLQLLGTVLDPIPAALGIGEEPGGEIVSWGDQYLHFLPLSAGAGSANRYYLRLAYPQKRIMRTLAIVEVRALFFSIFGLTLLIALTALLFQRFAGRYFQELRQWLYRLNEGNLEERTEPLPRDEEFREIWELLALLQDKLQRLFARALEEMDTLLNGSRSSLSKLHELSQGEEQLEEAIQAIHSLVLGMERSARSLETFLESSFTELDRRQQDMTEVAGGLLVELRDGTSKLVQEVHELEARIQEMLKGTEELQLEAQRSASSTDDLAAGIRELSLAISQIRESSQQNKDALEETIRQSEEGMAVVSEVEQRISSIRDSVTQVSGRVENLIAQNKRIGETLKEIHQITEKTSMLALNTAIIATQAGQHGGQFTFIADEIRDLSQRVKSNAEVIFELVRAIQEEITGLEKSFSESTERVLEGVQKSQIARDLLSSIATKGQVILKEMERIFATLEDQDRAAKILNNSMANFQTSLHSIRGNLDQQRNKLVTIQQHLNLLNDTIKEVRISAEQSQLRMRTIQEFFTNLQRGMAGVLEEVAHKHSPGIRAMEERSQSAEKLVRDLLDLIRKLQGDLASIQASLERVDRWLEEKEVQS